MHIVSLILADHTHYKAVNHQNCHIGAEPAREVRSGFIDTFQLFSQSVFLMRTDIQKLYL